MILKSCRLLGSGSRRRRRWEFCHSFIFHVGHVSVLIRLVGDGLNATVGQEDAVGAGDDLAIAALRLRIVIVGRGIFNSPGKAIWSRDLVK